MDLDYDYDCRRLAWILQLLADVAIATRTTAKQNTTKGSSFEKKEEPYYDGCCSFLVQPSLLSLRLAASSLAHLYFSTSPSVTIPT
jgi:hypothetical protein